MCRSVPSFEKPLENYLKLAFTHPFRWLCPSCNHIHCLALFLKRVANLAIFSIWRWQWCNFLWNYQWFFFKTYQWFFFKAYQWFFFKSYQWWSIGLFPCLEPSVGPLSPHHMRPWHGYDIIWTKNIMKMMRYEWSFFWNVLTVVDKMSEAPDRSHQFSPTQYQTSSDICTWVKKHKLVNSGSF